MCGISFYIFNEEMSPEDIIKAITASQLISHRGPDNSNIIIRNENKMILSFNRLMINDLTANGNQPFIYSDDERTVYCMCNGEIYNSDDILNEYGLDIDAKTDSDCECLMLYYLKYGFEGLSKILNSEHALIIVDINNKTNNYDVFVSTDRFGVRPLFMSQCLKGTFFSSELLGLPLYEDSVVTRVKPRHDLFLSYDQDHLCMKEVEYFNLTDSITENTLTFKENAALIKKSFHKAVELRMKSDREIGAFLSGGLDSSVICYEASNLLKENGEVLKTFSIGLPGSEDEIYAKKVAEFLGTHHTHFSLTKEEYINSVKDVIECIGSFDITTVRASIGQFNCAKKISETTNIIVLLSGDGSDEVFFSYDDGFDAPDTDSFLKREIELCENIHTSDGIRAERCTSHFGRELRVPFLDHEFVNTVLSTDVNHRFTRFKISKPLLREAYRGLLPDIIIDRPKVTFSDGIGSREDQAQVVITNYFKDFYTPEEFETKRQKYLYHCPPKTNEALYYREVFANKFSNNESVGRTIPYFWMPSFKKNATDPSAWFCEKS
jgi:asparagine synthase (glutamine-hydrolysing)